MNERDRVQILAEQEVPQPNRGGVSQALSSENHDAAVAYGINPQGGGMNPFDEELGETQSVCHQGGVMQVQCYDGYNQRGYEEVSMTMRSAMTGTEGNDADPKIAYGFSHSTGVMSFEPGLARREGNDSRFVEEATSTLRAKMGDNLPAVAVRYIVRRLTPTEAERLMGLPDGYLIPAGLRRYFDENGEPPPELVSEFVDIFDKFNAIMAEYEHKKPPKGKSYNQVAAWLKKISDPATCPDSPMYKAAGNGWATNQPRWILTRLLAIGEHIDPFTGEEDAPCS